MMLEMYSVKDLAAQAFLQPLFFRSRGEALRSFSDAVGDANHQFAKHPEDYEFYFIGSFDDTTGMIAQVGERPLVARAVDFAKR